jgi:hypothetical protein
MACATGMPPGEPRVAKKGHVWTPQPIPTVVLLDKKCNASPNVAIMDYQGGGPHQYRDQILWIADKELSDKTTIKITPKPAGEQDRWNHSRGQAIVGMLAAEYVIEPGQNAIQSGVPGNPPFNAKKNVRWKYNIQILRENGSEVCSYDPQGCWQSGSGACDY